MYRYVYYIILNDCVNGIHYFNFNWSSWEKDITDGTAFDENSIDELNEYFMSVVEDNENVFIRKYKVEYDFQEDFESVSKLKQSFKS